MDRENQIENVDSSRNEGSNSLNFKELISWAIYLIAAVFIALLLTKYVIVNAYIPTGSMAKTIMPKDRVLASRIHYLVSNPKRGDIVVFKYPDDEKVLYVKRVIGLPGEKVEIKKGKVYINDKSVDEPYIKEPMIGEFGPYEVPQDKYFMMGDNRNDSQDSRFWNNKYLDRDKMIGKVFLEYFPRIKVF